MIARVLAFAIAAAALVFTLTGAGSGDAVSLTVTFSRTPTATRHVAHLRCSGSTARADGFLRAIGARRACETARRRAAFLAVRPPSGRVCPQIFGGPERGRIVGTIGSRRVNRSFARRDGCESADWRRAMPLLPAPR